MSEPTFESKVFSALNTFTQQLQLATDAALAAHHLSYAQLTILRALSQGASTQAQLAQRLRVTPGNISQLLAKLEAAGHISRQGQGKAKLVSLNPSGLELLTSLEPTIEATLAEHFSPLSAIERQVLLAILERLSP